MSLPLPHTATVETWTGSNAADEPTFGTGVNLPCRFDRDTEYGRGENNEIITDALFIFKPDAAVVQKDRISITQNSVTYRGTVVEASIFDAIDGKSHHLEVRTISQ